MGQNIGTCATAILSSIGVNRNAKRVAAIHLSFNLIGTAVFMIIYYALHSFLDASFLNLKVSPLEIAICHSVFNISTTILLLPFSKILVRIAKMLHSIGDWERISDYARDLTKSALEIKGKR